MGYFPTKSSEMMRMWPAQSRGPGRSLQVKCLKVTSSETYFIIYYLQIIFYLIHCLHVVSGCVVLGGVLFLLTTVSAVFHYVTDLRDLNDFGSVLYFEFVRLSAVGFGDIMPEHEATLVGAIFKNLLLNIPSQIILFTIFIRVLPLLS